MAFFVVFLFSGCQKKETGQTLKEENESSIVSTNESQNQESKIAEITEADVKNALNQSDPQILGETEESQPTEENNSFFQNPLKLLEEKIWNNLPKKLKD